MLSAGAVSYTHLSVRARVANLTEYAPGLTIDELKQKLLEAFEEVYGLEAEILKMEDLDAGEIEERTKHFASWDWVFGRKLDFQYELSNRFPWGQVTFQMKVKDVYKRQRTGKVQSHV